MQVFKLHTQVGEFRLDDPLLDAPFGALEDAGTPVVIHVGSGPIGNDFTGPEHLARLLRRHPRLAVVVAHMGAPEYAEFLTLAETHEHVRLDTTMVFTEFFDGDSPFPDALLPRLVDAGPKVLFGSDFPTIPYAYLRGAGGARPAVRAPPGPGRRLAARGAVAQRRRPPRPVPGRADPPGPGAAQHQRWTPPGVSPRSRRTTGRPRE